MSLIDLMWHTVDVYTVSANTKNSRGNPVPTIGSNPTFASVPAMVQSANDKVVNEYKQREIDVTKVVFWIDESVNINVGDRVVYGGTNFKVAGLRPPYKTGYQFRADLTEE